MGPFKQLLCWFGRLLRWTALSILVVSGLLTGLLAFDHFFPPRYTAHTEIKPVQMEVQLDIIPRHPYLAEYRRMLIIKKSGKTIKETELFPDTGGYCRTQLYWLPNGDFRVEGYGDEVIVDGRTGQVRESNGFPKILGTYLGAFDRIDGEWQFLAPEESKEKLLTMAGG